MWVGEVGGDIRGWSLRLRDMRLQRRPSTYREILNQKSKTTKGKRMVKAKLLLY